MLVTVPYTLLAAVYTFLFLLREARAFCIDADKRTISGRYCNNRIARAKRIILPEGDVAPLFTGIEIPSPIVEEYFGPPLPLRPNPC